MDDALLTDADLARRLQVDQRTLARWRALGTGPKYVRLGRTVRYAVEDLQAWLDECQARSLEEERRSAARETGRETTASEPPAGDKKAPRGRGRREAGQ
jgi:predicted DNA-binding transcriptional regulator AlpA